MLQRITQTKIRFTLLILASLAIILGVIQNTQAQVRIPRPVPGPQLPPIPNTPPVQRSFIIHLNQNLRPGQTLDVGQIVVAHTQNPYAGQRLFSLVVTASSPHRLGAVLEVDHRDGPVKDFQNVDAILRDYLIPLRSTFAPVLRAQGPIHVASISVIIENGQAPIPVPRPLPSVQLDYNTRVYNQPLFLLHKARQEGHNLNGQLLKRVVLFAKSVAIPGNRFGATAQLIINGRPVGTPRQLALTQFSRTAFDLTREYGSRTAIGLDINSLQIQINGQAEVANVALRFE
jgi:hypothetical protein